MPYAVFFISILLGWRFNNAGLMLAATTLALSYFIFNRFGLPAQPQKTGGLSMLSKLSIDYFLLDGLGRDQSTVHLGK